MASKTKYSVYHVNQDDQGSVVVYVGGADSYWKAKEKLNGSNKEDSNEEGSNQASTA